MNLEELPTDQITTAIDGLDAIGGGVAVHYLDYLSEIDRREAFLEDGAQTMEDWFAYKRGCSKKMATDYVRLAQRLPQLPKLREALTHGKVTIERALLISEVAVPEDEHYWLEQAETASWASLERLVRMGRSISRDEIERTMRERKVVFYNQGGAFHFRARLPEAEGELVRKTFERIEQVMGMSQPVGWRSHPPTTNADLFVELCSTRLGQDDEPDRATVVVHVDVGELAAPAGTGFLESGDLIGSETLRRLSCDCRLQMVINLPNGEVLRVHETTRTVPRWLRRQLMKRDKGCRFPGCGRTRGLHAHHIIHYSRGGLTVIDNLVMLCGYHHRLVHDMKWDMHLDEDLRLHFIRPNGTPLTRTPIPLRQDLRERIFGPPPPSRGPGTQRELTGARK